MEKSSIRQIAGRAGRFTSDGNVSAFNPGELKILRKELADLAEYHPHHRYGGKYEQFNTYNNLKSSFEVTEENMFPRLTKEQI